MPAPHLVFAPAPDQPGVWVAQGAKYSLSVKGVEASVQLKGRQQSETLRLRFTGANNDAAAEPSELQPGRVNYLLGNDPKRWIRGARTYGRLRYQGLYPNTDVVWYGNEGSLEYDLVLRPGADPKAIRLHVEGARNLALQKGGVQITMAGGSLQLQAPLVYQERDGVRQNVPCQYELLADGEIGFRLSRYDASRAVVIDPVLVYASYYGYQPDTAFAGTDAAGNLYLASVTAYLPVTVDAQPGYSGARRTIGVSKFDASGTLQYATYVGADGYTRLSGFAVGGDGTVALVGTQSSAAFPFTETVPAGTSSSGSNTAFVMKLNAAGDGYNFVAQIGGSSIQPTGAAMDGSGNVYVTGSGQVMTSPGAYNGGGSPGNSFVLKYSPSGSLVYSAVLPSVVTQTGSITADDQGGAYVAGTTQSATFPGNPPGTTRGTGSYYWFLAKLDSAGDAVNWASFLSGAGYGGPQIARDPSSGSIYLFGNTSIATIPTTPGAWQPTAPAGDANFGVLASLSSDGLQFQGVTYVSGLTSSQWFGLAVTSNGVVVAGQAGLTDVVLQSPLQSSFPGAGAARLEISLDAGVTWSPASGAPKDGQFLWIDPAIPSVILDISYSSIYRSADAGVTWSKVFTNPNGFAVSFDSSALYTTDNNGLYKSIDIGATWTAVGGQQYPYPGPFPSQSISINPLNPQDIVVLGSYDGVVAQSLDGGVTFTTLTSTNAPSYIFNALGHTFTDGVGDIVVADDYGINRSVDRGKTWSKTLKLGYAPAVAQAPNSPSTLYLSDFYTGLYKSTDFGLTWTTVNQSARFNALTVSATDPNTIYAADYNGGMFQSTDGGVNFSPTGVGLDAIAVPGVAVDPANPSRRYATTNAPFGSFITKVNKNLTGAIWSTYYSSSEGANLISAAAIPGSSDVWVAGSAYGSAPLTQPTTSNSGTVILRISDATPPCSYLLSPQSQYVYNTGTIYAPITAPSGCIWTASSDASWITVKHGSSGTGSDIISAQVLANNTASTRTGHISAGGQTLTITEPAAGCSFTIPSEVSAPSAGGSVQITVNTGAGCVWDAEQLGPNVTVVSGGIGTGTGTVTLNVASIGQTDPAQATIQIAGQTVHVQAHVAQQSSPLQFIPVTPCRVADTRQTDGPFGGPLLTPQQVRDFAIPASGCGIPVTAQAYSVNVTVVPKTTLGYLTIWPSGQTQPVVSTLNSVDGRIKAGAAIVGAGSNGGAISVLASDDTQVILDINGYFVPADNSTTLAFYPVAPCRVADTRKATFGINGTPSLTGGQARDIQVGTSACGLPVQAKAYSMNFTAVPVKSGLGYLTVWPAGQPKAAVSTLNAQTGQVTANAAIVPAGTSGNISVFASDNTDLVIDVNGYFAPPTTGGLSLYTITPCRVLDSRLSGGSPLSGQKNIALSGGTCGAPVAQAYVTNATVVPTGSLGYLTLWPQSGAQPLVSTLNAGDGVVTSNMAIVPANYGSISAFTSNSSHLIVDLSAFFAQ